jgi:hypothetical protein
MLFTYANQSVSVSGDPIDPSSHAEGNTFFFYPPQGDAVDLGAERQGFRSQGVSGVDTPGGIYSGSYAYNDATHERYSTIGGTLTPAGSVPAPDSWIAMLIGLLAIGVYHQAKAPPP